MKKLLLDLKIWIVCLYNHICAWYLGLDNWPRLLVDLGIILLSMLATIGFLWLVMFCLKRLEIEDDNNDNDKPSNSWPSGGIGW